MKVTEFDLNDLRDIELIQSTIHNYPDFPKKGIIYRDICPLLSHPHAFHTTVQLLGKRYQQAGINAIAGIESRGFIFGSALAFQMGIPFIPIRKEKKLPGDVIGISYQKEYGEDRIEIQRDVVQENQNILVVDDLIATGGSAEASVRLIRNAGGIVFEVASIIELVELKGSEVISAPIFSLVKF